MWAVDVVRKHAHCLARWALAMGSTMAGEVEGRCEVVVVKRKDVMSDAVARISNVTDWRARAVHIPYMLTFVLINITPIPELNYSTGICNPRNCNFG